MRKQKKIEKAIERQYYYIDNPCGSTSPHHRCLHKSYVSYRFRHLKSEIGRLRYMTSETPIKTDSPNGNYITKIKEKFVFKPSRVAPRRIWYADSIENWQSNGGKNKTLSIAIEVLPRYPINVFFENTRKGWRYANELSDYLIDKGLITQPTYNNLHVQINSTAFGYDLSVPYKRFHIALTRNADYRKVDFGIYSGSIGQLSEVERKHFLWDNSTDYLSFVIMDSDVRLFERDLEELVEKKGDLDIPTIFSLKRPSFRLIVENNGNLREIYYRKKPLSIPRQVNRSNFFDSLKIEGY